MYIIFGFIHDEEISNETELIWVIVSRKYSDASMAECNKTEIIWIWKK